MKRAEILLNFMDSLQAFIERLNSYIQQGLEFFEKAKEWVQKILGYIEQGIERLVEAIGGRSLNHDLLEFTRSERRAGNTFVQRWNLWFHRKARSARAAQQKSRY